MKKILITGGAGFIGCTIAKMLSQNEKNEIHIIDDLSKGEKDEEFRSLIARDNVTFYEMDLTDKETYNRIEPVFDQIYHLAAVVGVRKVMANPSLTVKVNVLSTIYLLDFVRDMKNRPKILFTSSCENYAGSIKKCNIQIPTPENVPLCIEDIYNPRWSYAASKILGEISCIHWSNEYGFDATIVRYHNIYGPRMGVTHVIPEFILRLKKNPKSLEMWGGDQFRTFCYVTDAAKMTIKVMNNNKTTGKVINVGNDQECVKISSIGERLSEIMKITPEFIEKGAPEGSTDYRIPDLTLIKELGDYTFDVPFSDGILLTYTWYNNRYH